MTVFATQFETVGASSVFGGIFAFDSDLVSDRSTTGSGMSARALESLSLPAATTKKTLDLNTNTNTVSLQCKIHIRILLLKFKMMTKNAKKC